MAKGMAPEGASGTAVRPSGRRNASLSEQEIVAAALGLIAEAGVEALTMRALSDRLGVALGATYKYVANKRMLIELVAVELFSQVQETDTGTGDWQERIDALFRRIYDTFRRYPGLAWQITHRPLPPTRPPDLLETLFKVLADAGFSEESTHELILALMFYTAGGLLVNAADESDTPYRAFSAGLDLLLSGARVQLAR